MSGIVQGIRLENQEMLNTETDSKTADNLQTYYLLHCTVDDLGQIFDLLSAWKLKSKNALRDLKFNHNVAI